MGLVEITDIRELIAFLPLLVKKHKELGGYWEADLSTEDFVAALTNRFGKDVTYFGIKNGDKLIYFIGMIRTGEESLNFWLFYIDKEYRQHTKNLLMILKSTYKERGFKHALFVTSRITRSYDRWVSKFGAVKHLLTYKLEL